MSNKTGETPTTTTSTTIAKKEKNDEQWELEQEFILRLPPVRFCLFVCLIDYFFFF